MTSIDFSSTDDGDTTNVRAGQNITLLFNTSEPLLSKPTVLIQGVSVPSDNIVDLGGSTDWSVFINVTEEFAEGEANATIDMTDTAGNTNDNSSSMSGVTIGM